MRREILAGIVFVVMLFGPAITASADNAQIIKYRQGHLAAMGGQFIVEAGPPQPGRCQAKGQHIPMMAGCGEGGVDPRRCVF